MYPLRKWPFAPSEAEFWCKEGRFEEGKSAALLAADIYKKLGAMNDLEVCRTILWNIEVVMDKSTASQKSDSYGELLERIPLPAPANFFSQLGVLASISQAYPDASFHEPPSRHLDGRPIPERSFFFSSRHPPPSFSQGSSPLCWLASCSHTSFCALLSHCRFNYSVAQLKYLHITLQSLGAEGDIPGGPIEGLLRVFGQFTLTLPTG